MHKIGRANQTCELELHRLHHGADGVNKKICSNVKGCFIKSYERKKSVLVLFISPVMQIAQLICLWEVKLSARLRSGTSVFLKNEEIRERRSHCIDVPRSLFLMTEITVTVRCVLTNDIVECCHREFNSFAQTVKMCDALFGCM